MGNVISYLSSIWGPKSSEEPDSVLPGAHEEIPDSGLTGTQVEKPEVKHVETDEVAIELKSVPITTRGQWDEVLESAREEPAEIPVISMYLQLRAKHNGTYLCIREEGEVSLDGRGNALNTIFKVSRVYPPPIDKFQFVCIGGSCKNFVLYPEGSSLKSKKYEVEKDFVCQSTAEQTLLSVEIHNEGEFLISLESREGAFCGTDSEPVKFIPYVAENFERELAPL